MAKTKKSEGKLSFTLRELEKRVNPCSTGYAEALRYARSNPVDGERYNNQRFSRFRKSRFGPDDPISLADVLELRTKTGANYLSYLISSNMLNPPSEYYKTIDLLRDRAGSIALAILAGKRIDKAYLKRFK